MADAVRAGRRAHVPVGRPAAGLASRLGGATLTQWAGGTRSATPGGPGVGGGGAAASLPCSHSSR